MSKLEIARALASAHPGARLPCPVCAASLNAENLERHLAKVHPGASSSSETTWRGKGLLGLFPCTVAIDGGAVILRYMLGLRRRVVGLPCAIEVGAMFTTRPDAILQEHGPTVSERTGSYLRLVGDRAITIGCRVNTQFAEHWHGEAWTRGARRSGCDVMVGREAMVALEYELAKRGMLVPASA
ncbi:MAG: hypothetical protein SFX73_32030 [Kofleriaceae bacterium]|nr:hypothetical protein [Kofleriaceae bacterium]